MADHEDIETQLAVSVINDIKLSDKKRQGDKQKFTDKSDRATAEQVLDPRTRIILLRLINQNVISEIHGCISTGKEANVYYATSDASARAIKVYKTSILIFKDRDRYVTGEFRFRHGYSKHNPRKMVKLWAEKEMRNLKRLQQAGIPCPEPICLKMHVLVMGFLGNERGWAYPRLKDANIGAAKYPELYYQLIKYMRIMFHKCRLVHADLSEYNLLYNSRKLYIIDVSQSVEHDHPYALDFLRKDCANITDFFKKKHVRVMSIRQLFDFITDLSFGFEEKEMEEELDKIQEKLLQEPDVDLTHEQKIDRQNLEEVEEEVFKNAYIPRTMVEILDAERDAFKVPEDDEDELIYRRLMGLSIFDKKTAKEMAEAGMLEENEVSENSEEGSESNSEEENSAEDSNDEDEEQDDDHERITKKTPRGKRHEDKEAKRERKKASKEEARERRKNKMPKAVKKRKIKATSKRNG
ncbi:8143_t:CDS:2 [Paraglomus occultum]|uniref:Serine/threonine-protein kinase RIO1 n=1 Tax=Paraglomus occultum TaxID=144539 RepID=A0A9N8WH87_9GLOM|nr:8143_t:CDS:2 [Paraglomus occultum]